MYKQLSIRFFLRETTKTHGKQRIYLRLIIDRRKAEVSTGLDIEPTAWDDKKQRVKFSSQVNRELIRMEDEVLSLKRQMEENDQMITARSLLDQFLGRNQGDTGVLQYWSTTTELFSKEGGRSEITMRLYASTGRKVERFIELYTGRKDYPLRSVDLEFIRSFDHFLRNTDTTPAGDKLRQNTIAKKHSQVKAVLNRAVSQNLLAKNPYAMFRLKQEKTNRMALSPEELALLENASLGDNESLVRVKDFFLFSCYTGLRFSDAHALKVKDIKLDSSSGTYYIDVVTQKTDEPVLLPMLPKAMQLVRKYDDCPDRMVHAYVLPHISNQKVNTYLKVIADMVGLQRTITHHIGRHTFGTLAINHGIPVEVVQKLMGHSDIATTLRYAKVSKPTLFREMKKMEN
jgi:integrase/recombinase XerD